MTRSPKETKPNQSANPITTKRQSKSSTRAPTTFTTFADSRPLSLSPLYATMTFYFLFLFLFFLFFNEKGGGGGDCIQANGRNPNGAQTTSANDSLTVTEHQVAKLMEEDMGSAMQYLQGKGLCLMPISLATAISTATCHSRNPIISTSNNNNNNGNPHHNPLLQSNGEGPTSPSMSVLTVQSATMGNGGADGSVKDAASVSKPWSTASADFMMRLVQSLRK